MGIWTGGRFLPPLLPPLPPPLLLFTAMSVWITSPSACVPVDVELIGGVTTTMGCLSLFPHSMSNGAIFEALARPYFVFNWWNRAKWIERPLLICTCKRTLSCYLKHTHTVHVYTHAHERPIITAPVPVREWRDREGGGGGEPGRAERGEVPNAVTESNERWNTSTWPPLPVRVTERQWHPSVEPILLPRFAIATHRHTHTHTDTHTHWHTRTRVRPYR